MKLLYVCAQWHALAKLQLHHDLTLDFLNYTTVRLGSQMRSFDQRTCERITTRELPREAEARARRDGQGKPKGTTSRKPKKLGIFTIKFHVLGDYTTVIRRYGTTDSYSTETVSLVVGPKKLMTHTNLSVRSRESSAIACQSLGSRGLTKRSMKCSYRGLSAGRPAWRRYRRVWAHLRTPDRMQP